MVTNESVFIEAWSAAHPRWAELHDVVLGGQPLEQKEFHFYHSWHTLVASRGDTLLEVLSFATQNCGADDDLPLMKHQGKALREAKILVFVVREEFRRQGVGTRLQLAAQRLAKSLGCYQTRSFSAGDRAENHQMKIAMGFGIQRVNRDGDDRAVYFVKTLADVAEAEA